MKPIVEKMEKETGIELEKLEIWHNEKNADLMRSYREVITKVCGGQLRTPTFLNTDTNDVMCGEVSFKKLKEWATR
jgi:hypothetical protein